MEPIYPIKRGRVLRRLKTGNLESIDVYEDEKGVYCDWDCKPLPKKVISDWYYAMTHPTESFVSPVSYEIRFYFDVPVRWVCIYEVAGFDMMRAEVRGYGVTPYDAMQDCDSVREKLSKRKKDSNE